MNLFYATERKIIGTAIILAAFFVFSANARAAYFDISLPFTSQSPFGNWSSPWQDFCEEASVVMVAHYIWGFPLTPQTADLEMQIIKKYEELALGHYKDTSIEETTAILKNLYGFKNILIEPVHTIGDIKKEIASSKVVIVPSSGKLLSNPYFTQPGPEYHMLVIRGFDDRKDVFITNDPGTRRGSGLQYKQSVLFNAIHDWNNGDVMHGKKIMMVVWK